MKNAKATITVKIPKPRNTVFAILASKRGGSHRKDDKALRSKAKNNLKKILRAGGDAGSYFFAYPIKPAALISRYEFYFSTL